MCGLIAEFNTKTKNKKQKEANTFIIDQFQNQYTRGTEGFGIIRINNKQEIETDRACEPTKFLLDLYLKKSNIIIAHHRTPTSTHNKLDQTHPIITSNKQLKHDYYIIHNGMISTEENETLHKKHLQLGFKYTTEYSTIEYQSPTQKWNDSETLAIELALFIENKIKTIRITNQAVFIILQINKKTKKATKVLFGKNESTSNLNMNKQKNICQLSSEGPGQPIIKNLLYSFDIKDPKLKLTTQKIPFKKKQSKTPPYNYYSFTPYQKTIEKTKQIIPQPEKNKLRNYREWVTNVTENTLDYTSLPPIINNKYTATTCKDIKDKLNTITNSDDITHIIDDELDTHTQAITEIINEYKEILLIDHLSKSEIEEYMKQIKTILFTMSIVTNITETKYEKQTRKEQEEEKKEEKEETNKYKCGFIENFDNF